LRILIIEDEYVLADYAMEILEEAGFEVIVAGTGQKSLEILESDRDIGLIFSDLGLPDIDGTDLVKLIRSKSVATPIIIVSGWCEMSVEEINKMGVHGLLYKPYTAESLVEHARALINS